MVVAKYVFAVALIGSLSGAVQAQTLLPPAGLQDNAESDVMPMQQDASALVLRMDRRENAMRTMNGTIEQLQFQNRQLQENVRRLEDAIAHGGAPATDAGRVPLSQPAVPVAPQANVAPQTIAPQPGTAQRVASPRTGDAFDPASQPNAPGAPRALGIGPAPGLALPKTETPAAAPMDIGKQVPVPSQPQAGGTIIASTTPESPREEFDIAVNFFKQRAYGDAETSFRTYIVKHPKDKLAPDAIYYLGETYLMRNRPREAAEQYLKVSTDFSGAARAPEAMLRLGQALQALDAHEQACATFQEIGRKYPKASDAVKRGAESEIAKNKC